MERLTRTIDDGFVVDSNHHKALSAFEQVQIRRLYKEGKSYRVIQRVLGVSSKTVAKYLMPITQGKFISDDLG